MAHRIEVNGVTYDSVESMPPFVRRLYERTQAGTPDETLNVAEGGAGPIQHRTVVRTSFSVRRGSLEEHVATPAAQRKNAFEFTIQLGSPEDTPAEPTPLHEPNISSGAERQFRSLLLLVACLIAAVAAWFLFRVL